MRGGDKFWDFRTFNPPISKNNWANEYVAFAELKANTLVTSNTYLDVPVNWLGQQFIEEAEDLKRVNEKAYTHEYLGIPVGTGGDVFPNVEEFDADRLVEQYNTKVPLWKTFDNIYCGIDWGWLKRCSSIKQCEHKQKWCLTIC